MRQVTQKDISKELGLSQSTVALILGIPHHPLRKKFKAETIEMVERKAKELGYYTNSNARILRTRRSNLIVILNFTPPNEINGRKVYQLGQLIHEAGYTCRVIEARWWSGDARLFMEQLMGLHPEGVIMLGAAQLPVSNKHIEELFTRQRTPVVSLGEDIPGIPVVYHDAKEPIRQITAEAIRHGRRRLALLMPADDTRQMRQRAAGFQAAILEAGGLLPEKHSLDYSFSSENDKLQSTILLTTFRPSSFQDFSPYMAAIDQALGVSEPPDTLICANDEFAFSALAVARKRGVAVPEELFVSGFDEMACGALSEISLTTIRIPIEELCMATMDMLISQIEKPQITMFPEVRVFPSEVIWRESCPQYKRAQIETT
ncbi:MAG: LacI family DNA-binding transcriptional regulator [Chthoniobacterales bacterium]